MEESVENQDQKDWKEKDDEWRKKWMKKIIIILRLTCHANVINIRM